MSSPNEPGYSRAGDGPGGANGVNGRCATTPDDPSMCRRGNEGLAPGRPGRSTSPLPTPSRRGRAQLRATPPVTRAGWTPG